MKRRPSRTAEQHATRVAFFLPGAAIAAWAPLVPFAKARTGLDEGGLGLALLCLGLGSFIAMPLAGALAARRGCRAVLIVAAATMCAALPALSLAGSPVALGAALLVFGAAVGAMDCAVNMMAVMVERDGGRPMMSGFHAFYSIGGLTGAAAMTALLGAGFSTLAATGAIAAVCLVLLTVAAPRWRADRAATGTPMLARPRGIVLLIGAMCFVAFLAEGAVLDWSAVVLNEVQHMSPTHAGAGFATFSLVMTAARLAGDAAIARVGRRRAIVLGALVAGGGFLLATLTASWEAALAGYALVGAGCANIVPALFSLAGAQRTMPESQAIPAITTLGYGGVLAGPALIGLAAEASSLSVAFMGVAAVVACMAPATIWLRRAAQGA